MIAGRFLPLPVAKEVRALLPAWVGCAAAVTVAGGSDQRGFHALGVLTYCAGSLALGALSIGHEYTGRTLPLLLSQPQTRARLFLLKQGVLLAMLLLLAAVAWGALIHPSAMTMTAMAMMLTLAVLGGLSVSPLLTMLTRSPLAGLVFTIPIAGFTWLLAGALVAGPLKVTVFWRGLLALCAAAAVLQWRTFMRLETVEGRGTALYLPMAAAPASAGPRDRHAVWMLVKKEIGLQQLALAVAAFYVLAAIGVWLMRGFLPQRLEDPLGTLTAFYGGWLAALVGSLACAEERQLGTAEWQMLLPMASWKQWAVKVSVAVGMALTLAVGLPVLATLMSGHRLEINVWYAASILILTVVSLYVSSLFTSGVRALLASFPVALFVILPLFMLARENGRMLGLTAAVLLGGVIALVLWFALVNHRSAERGARRILLQLFCLTGCIALAGAVLGVLSAFHS